MRYSSNEESLNSTIEISLKEFKKISKFQNFNSQSTINEPEKIIIEKIVPYQKVSTKYVFYSEKIKEEYIIQSDELFCLNQI